MKSLFAILTLTGLMAQAAVLGDNDVVGKYYDKSGIQLARVFRHDGKLKIKFTDGCSAELSLRYNAWTGSCTQGSGYNQDYFQVKNIEMSEGDIILQARSSLYQDAEFQDDGSFTATKR